MTAIDSVTGAIVPGEPDIVRLTDIATGRIRQVLKGHGDRVACVAFSSDGRTVATGSDDGTIIVYDAATGQSGQLLKGHLGGVSAIGFSKDGSRILSAARVGDSQSEVKIWDATHGQELITLTVGADVKAVALTGDNRSVVACAGGEIRVWESKR